MEIKILFAIQALLTVALTAYFIHQKTSDKKRELRYKIDILHLRLLAKLYLILLGTLNPKRHTKGLDKIEKDVLNIPHDDSKLNDDWLKNIHTGKLSETHMHSCLLSPNYKQLGFTKWEREYMENETEKLSNLIGQKKNLKSI